MREWAGGGIVSTTRELVDFIKALFGLQFFKNRATLDKMTDISATERFGAHYGLGLYRYEINGKVFYGHGGFYGSILAYCPAHRITLSSNIGQSNPPFKAGALIDKVLTVIAE